MYQSRWVLRWGIVGMLWMLAFAFWLSPDWSQATEMLPYASVVFLDVGQGDAIFIETPEQVQVLIDGGPDGAVIRALSDVLSPWDRTIDMIIATHSDKDHIAGLIDVLDRFQVSVIVLTENISETAVSTAFRAAVEREGAEVVYARAGQVINLGASTTINIYSPAVNPQAWGSNASSIVAQVVYGDTAFMLTGDAPLGTEIFMAERYGPLLQSEVLKLGHHGSRISTGELFVDIVQPQYGVVSAGRNNSYGHPHSEPLAHLERIGARMVSTAELGNVHFQTDGSQLWLR